MRDAAIVDGDFIVVQKQDHAENGDIVVALLKNRATIKRFRRSNGDIHLLSANDRVKPIKVSEKNLIIQGKVIAIHRQLLD